MAETTSSRLPPDALVWTSRASSIASAAEAHALRYARTLGVNEYGVLTLIISIVTMMIALSDLGIGGSIVRFGSEMIARGDENGLRSVLSVALKAKLSLSVIVLAGAVIFLNFSYRQDHTLPQ